MTSVDATSAPNDIVGVVLAGGLASRMGGRDKGLLALNGRRLLDRVVDRLGGQLSASNGALALNANGDPLRFSDYDLPVVADDVPEFPGPLAGVLAGLDWAAARGARAIVTAAADTPFFPEDLAVRLLAAADAAGAPIALAETDGRPHPTFGLWPIALADDLRRALTEEGVRKILRWTDRHGAVGAAFDHRRLSPDYGAAADPFFNINTPEDLAEAERAVAVATAAGDRQALSAFGEATR